ncbi:MAG: response regulator [Acidobacteria bacterium]|nr:response regulator [Acidobacteriota bacterium]
MAVWLVRGTQARLAERLAEFFCQFGPGAASEDALRQACGILREQLDAEVVLAWKLDAARGYLETVAASSPDWDVLSILSPDGFPPCREVLERQEPLWINPAEVPDALLPPPLAGAGGLLMLPLGANGHCFGCLWVVFERAEPPTAEEQALGRGVARAVSLLLERDLLSQECQELRQRHRARTALAAEWHLLGLRPAMLGRLVAAATELSGASACGLYEYLPDRFRCCAAAGSAHLLPAELPLGDTSLLPWMRALALGRVVEVSGEERVGALKTWLPALAQFEGPVRFWPLGTIDRPLGVLLACGGSGEEADWSLLSLLAAFALEHLRSLEGEEHTRQRYDALFQHLPAGAFFLDRAGVVLAANPFLVRWSGYEAEEIERGPLASFLSPADWEAVSLWLQSPAPPAFRASVEWRRKDGGGRACELLLHALAEDDSQSGEPPLVLGFLRDTAAERELEEQWRWYVARWQGVLDSLYDGVWVLSPEGEVEAVNQRLAQLLGISLQQIGADTSQAEAIEHLAPQLASPDAARARWQHLAAHPEEVFSEELELRRPTRRVLERFARPLLDDQRQLVGRLEVYRDITPQRLLEDKIVEREKLAQVGQLVSGIAHELNNPLTAVTGYAQLLLTSSLPPRVREKAERLAQEAERAGRIVRNLLLFARRGKAERQVLELNEVLERTLALRAYELKVQNIQVVRDYAETPPVVVADPHQLQQVFLNLLLNAEHAIRSQPEHGRLTLRARGPSAAGRVEVEIADTGPGVPPDLLPYIFDPFVTTKQPGEGTGLGLYISRLLVREHGGDIRVESTAGGATFVVDLPVHRPRDGVREAPRTFGAARGRAPARARQSPRILVVDDEPTVAQLVADALTQDGYQVSVHTESQHALTEALRQPFDLAICDIRMPGLDGPAFYRLLRQQQSSLADRLLFTTGDTLARETGDFLEQVRLPFLPKPFHVEELQRRVRELLEEKRRSPAGGEPRAWKPASQASG